MTIENNRFSITLDGTTVYVYLPSNYTNISSVDATLYYPGVGGYRNSLLNRDIINYYNNNDNESRAFVAVEYGGKPQTEALAQIFEQIRVEYGININITDYSSHSNGGGTSLLAFSDALSQNPDSPLGMTLYDPYGGFPRTWIKKSGQGKSEYYPDEIDENGNYIDYSPEFNPNLIEQMSQNGSYIRLFGTRENDFVGTTLLNSAARNGIPTVIITAGIAHKDLVRATTKDRWLLYLNGEIEIDQINNKNNYKITIPVVDEQGNVTWNSYLLSDLQNAYLHPETSNQELLSALSALEATRVEVNYDYLSAIDDILKIADEMNNIDLNSISYTSTSSLLESENELITSLKSITNNLGQTLTKEINSIKYSQEQYLNLEKELQNDCENLNKYLQDLNNKDNL